jgi:hypothetical protein
VFIVLDDADLATPPRRVPSPRFQFQGQVSFRR